MAGPATRARLAALAAARNLRVFIAVSPKCVRPKDAPARPDPTLAHSAAPFPCPDRIFLSRAPQIGFLARPRLDRSRFAKVSVAMSALRKLKKSETLEIRLPYPTKLAFMARCQAD